MITDVGAEMTEAALMYDTVTGTPEPARARLGAVAARIGGGVALAMPGSGSPYWNKALGFGLAEPFTLAVLDEVLDFYRTHQVSQAVLQVVTDVLPDGFAQAATERGLDRGSPWIKLGGDPAAVGAARTDLRVGPVPAEQAAEWADMLLGTFGMPTGDLTAMMAETVGRAGWQPFGAWDGDRVVAGGNLFVTGGNANLYAAATSPSHRGRGAQSALIAARAAAAARAGARRLYAETGKPAAGDHNASLSNLVRAGLAPLYERDNWTWRP
ncbi:GNAT family N-acetyltransferase [Actinoplanes sp. HUAS TT8]|uniref:GNAT family N-acetyltransferase n=1 Tax=Actinoplanes sp. HUAS TT8 TaxID=3447453 RepID=UPI003F525AF3